MASTNVDTKADLMRAIRSLGRARRADRADVENVLATFDVKAFRVPGDHFDARKQRVLSQIKTHQKNQEGLIAARVLPGYERNGDVIRRETVSVFVSIGVRKLDD